MVLAPASAAAAFLPFDQVSIQSVDEATQHNAIGLAKANTNDFDGAIAEYSEAIRLDPNFADAFYNRGLAREEKGNLDDAIQDFSRAIALNPRHALAYTERGMMLADKNEWDRAIEDFSKALAIDPTDASTYRGRGNARSGKGDLDGAIADLTASLGLYPKSAGVYTDRANVKLKKKDLAGAAADYDAAITINPAYPRAYYGRAIMKIDRRDLDGAIADLNQTITLDPKAVDAYTQRGHARSASGDTELAINDYSEAIKRESRNWNAYYGRCRVQVTRGELDHAIADCTEAITLNSAFANAYFTRAMAFEKRGDSSAANRDYAQAQTLDPKLERRMAVVAGTGTGTGSPTLPVAGNAGNVYRPGAGVVLPRVLREVRPQYTAAALEAKIQGIVVLECVVGANGVVNDVRVVRSLDTAYGLDSEAIKAAKQWKFEPGSKDGKPVPVLISIELTFKMADKVGVTAPFTLPDAFSGQGREIGQWQEQGFDQDTARLKVAYPKEWATMTGFPDGVVLLQSITEPLGVVLARPPLSDVALNQAVSPEALKRFAEAESRKGPAIAAFGQARVGSQFWLWVDFGQVDLQSLTDRSPAGAFSYMPAAIDATRAWSFLTMVNGHLCNVIFFVHRLHNASAAEMDRLTGIAGPIFAKVLERISIEPR